MYEKICSLPNEDNNKVIYVKRQVETMLMNDGNLMEMAKETN